MVLDRCSMSLNFVLDPLLFVLVLILNLKSTFFSGNCLGTKTPVHS